MLGGVLGFIRLIVVHTWRLIIFSVIVDASGTASGCGDDGWANVNASLRGDCG